MVQARKKKALTAEPDYIWSKQPATVRTEFAGRLGAGHHPDDVFKQILGEISEHLASGQINNRDAHRAANEAFGRYVMTAKKHRKQAFPSFMPVGRDFDTETRSPRHKVAGWEWDHYLNGFVTSKARQFECSCGKPVPVPEYHTCKCGKIWNSYPIGVGGDKHQGSIEKFIAREIPVRKDVIVANKKTHNKWEKDYLQKRAYDDYDKAANDMEHEIENTNPFPTKHVPKRDTRSKGKTRKDWHRVDHSTQQYVSR